MADNSKKIKTAPVIQSSRITEEGGIEITWSAAENADKYAVKRADSYNGKYSIIGWTKDCCFEDSEVVKDKTYWYSIFAVKVINKNNKSVKASGVYGAVVTDIPAVESFETVIGEDAEIRLSWEYEGNADKFLVMRRNDLCSKLVPVATVEEKCFVDREIVTGLIYHYCVQPLWIKEEAPEIQQVTHAEKDSEEELEEHIETVKAEPVYMSGNFSRLISLVHLDSGEILSAKAGITGKAEISVRVVAGADGYILERSTDGEDYEQVASTQSGVHYRFTDKIPSGSKACYYRTRSFKSIGEETFVSPCSEAVNIKG